MHERRLPENVNLAVTITNPGIDALLTKLSELVLALAAMQRDISKQFQALTDLVTKISGSGLTPEQVEQFARIAAKVEAIDKKENQ
jgi:hypothetical protein